MTYDATIQEPVELPVQMYAWKKAWPSDRRERKAHFDKIEFDELSYSSAAKGLRRMVPSLGQAAVSFEQRGHEKWNTGTETFVFMEAFSQL